MPRTIKRHPQRVNCYTKHSKLIPTPGLHIPENSQLPSILQRDLVVHLKHCLRLPPPVIRPPVSGAVLLDRDGHELYTFRFWRLRVMQARNSFMARRNSPSVAGARRRLNLHSVLALMRIATCAVDTLTYCLRPNISLRVCSAPPASARLVVHRRVAMKFLLRSYALGSFFVSAWWVGKLHLHLFFPNGPGITPLCPGAYRTG